MRRKFTGSVSIRLPGSMHEELRALADTHLVSIQDLGCIAFARFLKDVRGGETIEIEVPRTTTVRLAAPAAPNTPEAGR